MLRRYGAWFAALFFICAFLTVQTRGEAASAKPALAVAITASPPPIDGTLGDAWHAAAHTQLAWDFSHGRQASDATDVYLLADDAYLYVAFAARQRDAVVATQQTNNVGEGSDDEVFVYLWPSGSNGFAYAFSANPRGTRYQSSSENTAYAPDWLARGTVEPSGYIVTMRIPLSAIRGDGRGTWLVQFARRKFAADETDEWSHDGGQSSAASSIYAGSLLGMSALAKAARVQPRVAIYGLADAAAASAGGATTRAGADLSIPITPTASLLATVHPDYSNVERDQQTIAPTAFQRAYTEIRPFFTQTANTLDRVNCYGCPYLSELYTPGIPTPRRGYAIEGVQGPISVTAFDAVGDARIDTSSDVTYTLPSRRLSISLDRTSADLTGTPTQAGVHDDVSTVSVGFNDLKHVQGYLDYGHEQGTFVTSNAQRYDTGIAYYTKDDFDAISFRKVGASYAPYDGLVQLSDIAGYSAQLNHTIHFPSKSPLATVNASAFLDRYQGSTGGTDLSDDDASISVVTRSKFSLGYQIGTSYARLPGDLLRPYTQTGAFIGYDANTPTATSYQYVVGHYADGYLYSAFRTVGFTLARRTTINLELDSTDWRAPAGARAIQWLERVSATYVLDRDSSAVVGARKIVGAPPPIGVPPATVLGTNLTFAFQKRLRSDEIYLVYGDASAFSTRPGATLKLIHYFGAQKGT